VGTPASAPSDPQMRRKFRLTTIIAVILTVPVILTIHYGWITIDQIDLFKRFGPDS
jgi:predicted secreted protein